MKHQMHDLDHKLEKSIEWRERVADRYPHDLRTHDAVSLLKTIREELPSLESDQLIEAINYYEDLEGPKNINDFEFEYQDEIADLLGTVGFQWKPTPTEFVERLITSAGL